MSKINKWLMVLAVPAGIVGTWLGARVWFALSTFTGVVTMVVAKQVLLALAAALGMALASPSAHAQGSTGFVYARDRYGNERLVYQQFYEDLNRFGQDLNYLGHAYDGGVRAVLDNPQTQQFITFALGADPSQPGYDMLRATLTSRNAYNGISVTQVFVSGFGGTMIGNTAGSIFGAAYGGNPSKSPTGSEQQY